MAKTISLAKATKAQLVAELKRRIREEVRADEGSRVDSELKALLTSADGVKPAKRGKATGTGKTNPGRKAAAAFAKAYRADKANSGKDAYKSPEYKAARESKWALSYEQAVAQVKAGAGKPATHAPAPKAGTEAAKAH